MSVTRFSIPLAGGNHNVVFAFDYDGLLELARRLRGYMRHRDDCPKLYCRDEQTTTDFPCTCGLDALLREIGGKV